MLLFYQLFNIILFAVLNFVLIRSLSDEEKREEMEKTLPFPIKIPPFVYYTGCFVFVFCLYLVAATASGLICLVVSWI